MNGKLFLDLKHKVAQKELIGENKVLIDQLAFGEKTDSPDATSLPVPLAVALLKDRKGQIDVDVPVRGDLTDPDFKYGRAVLKAVVTLLTKVAMRPFSLLAGLVGGGDDLNTIEFPPGHDHIGPEEMKKLAALAKALAERPGLFLEITGTADPKRDGPVLAEEKLTARLREMGRRDTSPGGATSALGSDEEARLIDAWYTDIADGTARPAGSGPSTHAKRARLLETVAPTEKELKEVRRARRRSKPACWSPERSRNTASSSGMPS